jgi:DNA-binding transcriptional regulator YhcF (GntR family)
MGGLKSNLLELIKQEKIVPIDRLRQYGEQMKYIDSNVERRLRELRNAGFIERVVNGEGVVVSYKLKEADKIETPFKVNGKTLEEIKREAEGMLKNIKFGDKRQTAVLSYMKTLKTVRTDKDKIRLYTQIIYSLRN